MDYSLLKTLCDIHAPSGNESLMTGFLLNYIKLNKKSWKVKPKVYAGDDFQDCIVMAFGKPEVASFAHIDSIGFTVAYNNKLVPIGGPEIETGFDLVGEDSQGKIATKLVADPKDGYLACDFKRTIERGTTLTFKSHFKETKDTVQSCYLDNRLGVFAMLKVCETLENGVIVFSCYEEHGGGTVPFILKFLWKKYQIKKCLVADITWSTVGVLPGKGVAISMRDSRIPRKKLEVESAGGSDGREIQNSLYPIDWCFIGAAEENVHSPTEKVQKKDIDAMIDLYKLLFEMF
jgi:putative aminopeptidase FrvX